MWLITRLLLSLLVQLPLCLALLTLGALAGASLAARAADKRAAAKWRTSAVQRLTDASASDVHRILGELPPWVADSAFQKVRGKEKRVMQPTRLPSHPLGQASWINDFVRQLWPYIDKAVADIVHAQVKEQLEKLGSLKKFGIAEVGLQHFSLGPAPMLGGIKLWPADVSPPSAVCMDVDLRVSGADSNALAHVKLLVGSPLVIQLAALQLRAVVRICFRQLGAKLPPFGAVTVSLLGKPFLDFSLTALSGDLMAIPGLETAVSAGVTKGVSSMLWPQRLVVPLSSSAEDCANLHPRTTGVLLVRIRQARGLPVTDASPGSCIDPYITAKVQGHSMVLKTQHLQKTRCPTFDTVGILPVIDAAHERLSIELWDENSMTADELVSTTDLAIADALAQAARRAAAAGGDAAAAPPVFSDWVPLRRQSIKVTDVSAGVAAATGRLRSLVSVSSEEAAPTSPGGELLLEFTHVPLERPRGAIALPQGWTLLPGRAIMTVRLLFASQLHAPPGWTARMTPVVTLAVLQGEQEGQQSFMSTPGTGANCSWHETFEYLVDLGDDDDQSQGDGVARPPPAPVRLHLVASAAPKGGDIDAVAGALSGAASSAMSMVTLGVVSSKPAADSGASLNLHGAAGGLLGRQPSCEEDAGLDACYDATTFCGRAILDVRDMARKVALHGEPQVVKLDLIDTVAGSITCVVDIQRLASTGAVAAASAAPVDASEQCTRCGCPPASASPSDSTPSPAAGDTALPTSGEAVAESVGAASRPTPKRRNPLLACWHAGPTDA
jgi:hypothetical protein